jgi:hypothetical protein
MIGFTSPLNLCLPAESKMREYEIEVNCKPGDNTCSKSCVLLRPFICNVTWNKLQDINMQ